MDVFKDKNSFLKYLLKLRNERQSIGYVPTMGALHEGHLSLIREAKKKNKVVIGSIFVNPTQFNEKSDFERYPKEGEKDKRKLEEIGLSALYLPAVEDLYPRGLEALESYDFGDLETVAEGKYRPGHFQGVAQVLSRFLTIIRPDRMYMGQKDYQQLLITKELVKLLGMELEVIGVPIVRATDGLALSSRNARLSEDARRKAPAIFQTLKNIERQRSKVSATTLITQGIERLQQDGIQVEYLLLADAQTLEIEKEFKPKKQILLIAAWLDGIRLIDNILLIVNVV